MMSGVLKMGRDGILSGAGRAGPRRLAMIALGGTALVALGALVVFSGSSQPPASRDASMKQVDALPGGLHSTPEMNALAFQADTKQAEAALRRGQSYTPALAPSVPVFPAPPKVEQPAVVTLPQPVPVPRSPHAVAPVRVVIPTEVPIETPPVTLPPPRVIPVQAVVDPKVQENYKRQIDDMFSQWGGRYPKTDVVMPPTEAAEGGGTDATGTRVGAASQSGAESVASRVSARSDAEATRVLIPAGRGIYAHPILALSSDQSSPVVLQADSGPIAGDRMIGTFAREQDRLVIHVNQIVHNGEAISADGVVIAPDTMEAAVASKVDEHYLTRFILPAAAAFVSGLGQALATTSNSTSVLSPFGGATTSTNLNFRQQLGVAAGVAGSQIGNTLNAEAPKGPTVSLEANVAVGVMFLSNVVTHHT